MKKSNIRTGVASMLVLGLATGYASAQGSLTPPGAPAPTMKTLDQIEPRTPLVASSVGVGIGASGTITISQSGSYYLTRNLTVTSGNGITINSSGVTVDLKGFTIRSTSATSNSEGIYINSSRVSIYNGHIESGTVYDGSQYTGSGFDFGIYASYTYHTGIRIRDITISGVDSYGIYIASDDSLVESCIVEVAGVSGIKAAIVCRCRANQCGSIAITAITVNDCYGTSTGSHGISATLVANSFGITDSTSLTADGIHASGNVQNSYGKSAGDDGIQASGTVSYSYGQSSGVGAGAYGISATIAIGCRTVGGQNITHKYNMP